MANQLEPGDVVMCTVERIAGAVVFVKIDNNGQGSIVLSEVAPGRIRNLRDYVVPKKRIICKVLRISNEHVDLSLRRVTPKEQKELREQYKLEKSYTSILKNNLKNANELITKIKENETLYEFFERAKTDTKTLETMLGKENAKKIAEILKTQKQRKKIVRKEFQLSSEKPNGITLIKEVIGNVKGVQVNYLSAGTFTIEAQEEDLKKADTKIREILNNVEKQAKKREMKFSVVEK